MVSIFLSPQFKALNPATSKGIAIVGLTTGLGKWQYSIDGGLTYHNMPAVSETNAFRLQAIDRVRFIPAHVNCTSSALSLKRGAAVKSWNRRASATRSTPVTAMVSQVSHLDCAPTAGAASSADVVDGVCAIAVDALGVRVPI